jgi:lipopolysaccharide export system protein LptA
MGTSRNRNAGHSFELEVIKDLKEWYPDAVSSRSESRNLDNQKVDICYTGDIHIQCKNTTIKPDYHKIINQMPSDKKRVIVHKLTKKVSKNFVKQGQYVIMKYEDFLDILKQLNK